MINSTFTSANECSKSEFTRLSQLEIDPHTEMMQEAIKNHVLQIKDTPNTQQISRDSCVPCHIVGVNDQILQQKILLVHPSLLQL